jgi:hypothetical protein
MGKSRMLCLKCGEEINKSVNDKHNLSNTAFIQGYQYAMEQPAKPNLGCATTGELLEEIKTRIVIDGNLDYRTVDSA